MDSSIHRRVTSQFAPTASAYAASAVHANADELGRLVQLAEVKSSDAVLDVATGAGHLALAMAPYASRVVAFDLTPSMLDQTVETARAKGITNLEAVQGEAELLPFDDASFDVYAVRLAAHHFADIRATIREAVRVLAPGGRYFVLDTTSPEDDGLDEQLNEIELIRDPSHVRNYRPSEWRSMLREGGLHIVEEIGGRCGEMEVGDWMRRQRVTPDREEMLMERFENASPELAALLELRSESGTFYFTLPQATFLAGKP